MSKNLRRWCCEKLLATEHELLYSPLLSTAFLIVRYVLIISFVREACGNIWITAGVCDNPDTGHAILKLML